jgi:putative phosphoesterase
MKIGLISDTHGWLDPEVFEHFSVCDEIWHAGDVGNEQILDELESFKPLVGVYGNIDGQDVRRRLPVSVRLQRGGVEMFMTHIGGAPGRLALPIRAQIEENKPNIFICGHSHILKIVRDPIYSPMLHMNPGAAGRHGFHTLRTIVRFDVNDGNISNVEVVHLGDPNIDWRDQPLP